MKVTAHPALESEGGGNRYKDVDGSMLLVTNTGHHIRAFKRTQNHWFQVITIDGKIAFTMETGPKAQREVCNAIEAHLAGQAAA
jgi:hypothetical protein